MKIYRYIHSCILLEKGNTKIIIDPGRHSFLNEVVKNMDFSDIKAIFITHRHGDHTSSEFVKNLQASSSAPIYTNSEAAEQLKNEVGVEANIISSEVKIGDFTIKPIKTKHEKILAPLPEHTSYLVNDIFLHPGDSLDEAMLSYKPKVFGCAVGGRWGTEVGVYEFIKRLKPEIAIPIHDATLIDKFRKGKYAKYQEIYKDIGVEFKPMEVGENIEV